MKFHKKKLLAIGSAVALTFAVAACSSNGDDDQAVSTTTPTTPTDPTTPAPPAPLSELATAQADAAAAATTAMTASGEAATAAEAAVAAVANLATMQTGAMAGGLADEAQTAAGKAMMAYMDAKAASEAAAEAEEVTAAVEARVMAEEAMANAVKYAMMASEKGTAAETAAIAELMIEGTVKTVGGTSLDATGGASTVTTNGNSVITGLIKGMNPMTKGDAVPGRSFVAAMDEDNANTDDIDETVAITQRQAVAERPLTIGKAVDSPDDLARLMLVTSYAGSNSVKVYADTTVGVPNTDLTGRLGSDGRIQTEGVGEDNDDTDVFVTLKSVGTYYKATEETGVGTDNQLDAMDVVGAKTEGEQVFSYLDDLANEDEEDDRIIYVVLKSRTIAGANTDVIYQHVDITVVGPDVDDDAATVDLLAVKANIPEATEYKHIHFGLGRLSVTPRRTVHRLLTISVSASFRASAMG